MKTSLLPTHPDQPRSYGLAAEKLDVRRGRALNRHSVRVQGRLVDVEVAIRHTDRPAGLEQPPRISRRRATRWHGVEAAWREEMRRLQEAEMSSASDSRIHPS